jgi:F0F1-type ATP synthase delta subunit
MTNSTLTGTAGKISTVTFISHEADLKQFANTEFSLREMSQVKEVNDIIAEAFQKAGFEIPSSKMLNSTELDTLKAIMTPELNEEIKINFFDFGRDLILQAYCGF